jgi:fructose-1,6-bisphosphatase-3
MDYSIHPRDISQEKVKENIKFLQLLSDKFPNIESASTEIINLEAIMNLPKGTEHFLSDIHGEYETFKHVLSNASGVIKRKIDEVFGDRLNKKERQELATLIYYPKSRLSINRNEQNGEINKWYESKLLLLIEITRSLASKYTRSKVRKSLPCDFQYIIEELLNVNENLVNKEAYFTAILKSIIDLDRAEDFIFTLSKLIQHLAIDRLHIVGDIYDRGPSPDKVMDELLKHKSVDIQWGNHDVVWMGAAAGSLAYISIVVRISARYDNLDTLEDGYGINLHPLINFASEVYSKDKASLFVPKSGTENLSRKQLALIKQIHKAISVIQFKLEGQIIQRNPHFEMDDRTILDRIDYKEGTVIIEGRKYSLLDNYFPTIDPENPFELTEEEKEVMSKLQESFLRSEKLQRHITYLYNKGSMYLKYNGLLLFHGAVPLNNDGSFKELTWDNKKLKGKALLDYFDDIARKAYYLRSKDINKTKSLDTLWYLWCGPESPLFGKKKMATFERYFLKEKETHNEARNPYFSYRDNITIVQNILSEFGLDPKQGHIVNGHVPVKVIKGESPVKADGQLIVIDGGMSRAYQKITGIAGYTLIYNSFGLVLVAHQAFESQISAIREGKDMVSDAKYLAKVKTRKRVADTDIGTKLKSEIYDLKLLLAAYHYALVKEKK